MQDLEARQQGAQIVVRGLLFVLVLAKKKSEFGAGGRDAFEEIVKIFGKGLAKITGKVEVLF